MCSTFEGPVLWCQKSSCHFKQIFSNKSLEIKDRCRDIWKRTFMGLTLLLVSGKDNKNYRCVSLSTLFWASLSNIAFQTFRTSCPLKPPITKQGRNQVSCIGKQHYDEHNCFYNVLQNISQKLLLEDLIVLSVLNLKGQSLFLDVKYLKVFFVLYILTKYIRKRDI